MPGLRHVVPHFGSKSQAHPIASSPLQNQIPKERISAGNLSLRHSPTPSRSDGIKRTSSIDARRIPALDAARNAMVCYGLAQGLDYEQAEDLAQEVCLKAVESRSSKPRFLAWFQKVWRTTRVDYYRKSVPVMSLDELKETLEGFLPAAPACDQQRNGSVKECVCRDSKTWEDMRKLLPPGEFEVLWWLLAERLLPAQLPARLSKSSDAVYETRVRLKARLETALMKNQRTGIAKGMRKCLISSGL